MGLEPFYIWLTIVLYARERHLNPDLTLLIQILASLAAIGGLLFMIYKTNQLENKLYKYEPIIQDIGNLTSVFRFEKAEDGSVIMDERLGSLIQTVSSGMAKSIQMSVMGSLSGQARMEKGLKGAIAADIIEEKMPLVNMIGDFVGINTKKYITKHPDAMGQLASLAGPYLQQFLNQRNNGVGQGQNVSSGRAGYG